MKTFLTLLGREVKSYFYSPIAYVVMFYFLVVAGFNFYIGVEFLNRGPTEVSVVEMAFNTVPFWWAYVLIFPLITMRTFSEEYRMGTFEMLTTAPVHDWQVVAGKFLGAFIFYCILWSPTFLHFAVFQFITGKVAANAAGAYWGSYLLLALMGAFFTSIGCLASSLTKDQINAAVISFSFITIWFFFGLMPDILSVSSPETREIFSYIAALQHMADFSRGLIDSRRLVWYISMTLLMGYITLQVFQARKWNEGKGLFALLVVLAAAGGMFGSHILFTQWKLDERAAIAAAVGVGVLLVLFCYRVLLGLKGQRLQISLNVLVQLLIVTGIVVMVNYISFRHFKRWDFSRNQKFALSSQTQNLLKNLEKPVKAIIFFNSAAPGAGEIYGDMLGLLKEYEYGSNKKLTVEIVDPYRNITRAKDLAAQYKFGPSENILILDYDGRSKFINAQEMVEMDMGNPMMGMPPEVRAFKGESAITSTLLELVEEKQKKVYLVGGHGEPDLNGDEITGFREYVKRQNVAVEPLNLGNVDAVPEDANAVVIFSPRADYSERDVKLLSDYWEKKGRLMVMLNAEARTPRLHQWLASTGITPRGDVVLKKGVGLVRNANNQLVLGQGVQLQVAAAVHPGSKDVLRDLVGMEVELIPTTMSLAVERAQEQIQKVRFTTLLEATDPGVWGETEFSRTDAKPFFDPQRDTKGPLTLAVAAERGATADPNVKVETARMVVFGNGGFLTDAGLRMSAEGLDLGLNSLNWVLNREQTVSGIPPKEKKTVNLTLTEKQLGHLALSLMLGIPGVVALFGLATWLTRRG